MIKNLSELDLESLVAGLKLDRSPFKPSSPSLTSNLVCSNQNHIFVYIEQIGAFLSIHLATSKQAPQTIADSSVQYLNLNSPPVGRLKKCQVSPDGAYIMIVCDKSVTVVELPSKWGKFDRYEGGKTSIICKSTRLNVSKNLDIIDALWHSTTSRDTNVAFCLTSDNYLRFFRIGVFSGTSGTTQFKEFHLEKSYSHQTSLSSKPFKIISIEIGAKLRYCDKFAYPIFALKSNGQVECVIEYEQNSKFEYLGPLDLSPYCMDVEEDNQVKGFVCLRGSPNCLAILLTNGVVHHCLFMTNLKETLRFYESENNFKEYYGQETAEANLISGEALLYVYESVKLDEDDSISNFQFLSDTQNNWRYFFCHSNGVHSISLPWFESLQGIYEKDESLNEFDESKLCEISQLISTRPFLQKNSQVFIIGSSLFFNYAAAEQAIICLTNEPKLIDINITTRANMDQENESDEFVNYIVSLMKRDASMPHIKNTSANVSSSESENAETRRFMNNAINLIKSEYIEKQRMVIAEFKKKSKQLKQQENLQFELIKELDEKLDELKSKRERILTSVEKLFEDEQRLKKRMENILNQLFMRSALPKSDVENEIHSDLRAIDRNLKESINKILESRRILTENRGSSETNQQSEIKSNVDESDTKLIKTLLKNQSDKIKSLIQKVETVSQSIKSVV